MNRGFKSSRAVFGNDSEAYVSSLLKMARNPNGSRRPDLLSINGRLKPKLSIELKSSATNKGSMVDAQLHYGLTTGSDYRELFGENIPDSFQGDLFKGTAWSQDNLLRDVGPVAYYYGIIKRLDRLKTKDVQEPYAQVRMKWGNITLVPHSYAFASFAVQRSMKTGESFEEVLENLKKVVIAQMERKRVDVAGYETSRETPKGRRTNPHAWFDLHGSDILALYNQDESRLSKEGKKRIELMRKHFPVLEELVRIPEIPGPNGTLIRVLAEKEHRNLFDKQLRKIVEERVPTVEKVSRARLVATELLDRLKGKNKVIQHLMIDQEELMPGLVEKVEKKYRLRDIPKEERAYLERLTRWLWSNEEEFSEYFVPF